MGNLILYTEKKQELKELAFVKDIKNQNRISEVKNEEGFFQQFSILMNKIAILQSVKENISDINKKDIVEMILLNFYYLTMDEINYAFKLERYGVFESKTEHYQNFNADYISNVLLKYKNWKVNKIRSNNIKMNAEKRKIISESEQERIMIDAIDRVKKEVKDTGEIHGTAHHVYDFMIDTGRMEKPDAATRKACYKIALRNQIGEFEKNAKLDYSLKKQLIKTLSNLGAGNDRTIKMAKTLALADYFKNK